MQRLQMQSIFAFGWRIGFQLIIILLCCAATGNIVSDDKPSAFVDPLMASPKEEEASATEHGIGKMTTSVHGLQMHEQSSNSQSQWWRLQG